MLAAMSQVRAAVVHAPGRFAVESFPQPDPEPGAALLRLHFSGICGTDKDTWRGVSPHDARPVPTPEGGLPLIGRHEHVGLVVALWPVRPADRPLRLAR